MRITQTQISLLRLIKRSVKPNEEWAMVQEALCSLFTRPDSTTELFTFEKLSDGGRIKLTPEGETVLKWL